MTVEWASDHKGILTRRGPTPIALPPRMPIEDAGSKVISSRRLLTSMKGLARKNL